MKLRLWIFLNSANFALYSRSLTSSLLFYIACFPVISGKSSFSAASSSTIYTNSDCNFYFFTVFFFVVYIFLSVFKVDFSVLNSSVITRFFFFLFPLVVAAQSKVSSSMPVFSRSGARYSWEKFRYRPGPPPLLDSLVMTSTESWIRWCFGYFEITVEDSLYYCMLVSSVLLRW